MKTTPRYVTESYVNAPGFPQPIYLTGVDGRKSKPRWIRRDVRKPCGYCALVHGEKIGSSALQCLAFM